MPWGVAAAAVVGAGATISEGHQNRKAGKAAKWLQRDQQDLISRARSIADRSYTPYTGNRVADLSPNERNAMQIASDSYNFDEAGQYLDKAGRSIDGISTWGTETMDRYMNPYVDKVVGNTLKRENEAYQSRLGDLRSNAAVRGAFGGDRATLLEASETGRHLDTVGDITAKGYSDAYTQALNTWQADNNTKLAVADAYRAVGGDVTRMNSQQITDLLRTGGADRVMRQMQLDVDYNDFLEQRDWSVNNLQPLMQAVGQAGGSQGPAVPPDQTASQLLGLASTLIGYYGGRGGGGGGAAGGTGAGGGTAAPVSGYRGSGMGDYWNGGNSGTMLG